MFDVAIIGSGPAGISAALTLKLHNKNIIWFGSDQFSDKVGRSEKIANYPGVGMVSGKELNKNFAEQISAMGLAIENKMVTSVMWQDDYYSLIAENEIYEAKTLLLSTGVATARQLAGEENLLGSGVSYCATCDGFLYKGKTIAVICENPRFEHEAEYLAEMAGKVYFSASYKGKSEESGDCNNESDPVSNSGTSRISELANVEQIGRVVEIKGRRHTEGIVLADGKEIPCDGVFIMREAIAPATLLPDLETDGAHIPVNNDQETNLQGCYAAGDCTGRPYQIAKAVGEGNVAAFSITAYLSK